MSTPHDSAITYIVDGNNFVCEERNTSKPSCAQLSDLLSKIEKWLIRNVEGKQVGFAVIVVFDPGARNCDLNSHHVKVEIAAHGEKADKTILRIARRLRNGDAMKRIVVISNDEREEFAVLKRENFEKKENSFLRELLSSRLVKNSEFIKDNIDPTENPNEFEVLFGINEGEIRRNKNAVEEDCSYYEYFMRLDDRSPKSRLAAVSSLRRFPNDSVVSKINDLLEKEKDLSIKKRALHVLFEIAGKYEIDQQCKWRLENTLKDLLMCETDGEIKELATKLRNRLLYLPWLEGI